MKTTTLRPASVRGVGSHSVGTFQVIIGIFFTLIFGSSLLSMSVNYWSDSGARLFTACCLCLSLWLLQRGLRKCSLYNFSLAVQSVLGGRAWAELDILAAASKRSRSVLVRDLREISRRGVFPGAYVDLKRCLFVAKPGGVLPPIPQEGIVLRESLRPSVLPFYFLAATWLLYALVFPLSGLPSFIVAALLSAVVYVIAGRRCAQRIVIKEAVIEPPAPPPAVHTGNQALDEVLTTAIQYMGQLTELESALANSPVAGSLKLVIRCCTQIFDYIKKAPNKIRQIRQFMNYYLPTTIELLQSYEELYRQPVKGENIASSMKRIEEAMVVIRKAFEKELDDLYSDKAMDISVDIEVLQNMLEQEGLSEGIGPLSKKANM